MKSEVKELIHYCSAVFALFFGFILCVLGFFSVPVGEVHESVLWVLGQCFVFTGSVFGITLYVKNEIEKEIKKHEGK